MEHSHVEELSSYQTSSYPSAWQHSPPRRQDQIGQQLGRVVRQMLDVDRVEENAPLPALSRES